MQAITFKLLLLTVKRDGINQQQLPDAAAVQEYLKAAKQREVFETEDDHLKGICDKVLTLISCSYEWSDARNIVLAVPVSGAFCGEKCS